MAELSIQALQIYLTSIHNALCSYVHIPIEYLIPLIPEETVPLGNIRERVLELFDKGEFRHTDVLVLGFYVALVWVILRYMITSFVSKPLGRWCMCLEPVNYEENKILDKEFERSTSKVLSEEHKVLLPAKTNLPLQQIVDYFKAKRMERRQRQQLHKFTQSFWELVAYTFLVAWGVYVHHDQPYLTDSMSLWEDFPIQHVRPCEKLYYVMELGLYLNFFVYQFLDHRRSDWVEYFVHHSVTLFLLLFSWLTSFIRVGLVIMIIHDTSDPLLNLAKIFNYTAKKRPRFQICADVTFAIFALVFFVTRILFYPGYLLKATFITILEVMVMHPCYYVWNPLMGTLFVLNVLWFFMICKVIQKALSGKLDDVRSDDDIDTDEGEGDGKPKKE
uniref:TLC domain-containing protein n=1 Tax=Fibrocapsa japonica TaxID=94617 RepID=A0A7S2V1S2_9STRA|mmetsp:Transcript_24188/g.35172  ORF Transcript_24188/g.35172 Transcript_24188/m.35172 type:complete len:389 (+) Transcript_24188:147-1313(+)|eukprot:CAMPEP_0113943926 /NCGR_PEP_ID=MMETSP1339-20121228/29600_1 /TAXON_ID=94617 /ORGANISM="Fibrocapsa japonica" /LENGTH=388 /DNA_ID=CAMNT_0000948931 /DNA_START=147 /DNA_END=1313 /DNA_ORIENTATION=- /assembly_acc=CAM_ASM_000762